MVRFVTEQVGTIFALTLVLMGIRGRIEVKIKTILPILSVSLFTGISPQLAAAELGTQTIPLGIYSPSVRMGTVSGLSEKYTDSGNLANTVDLRSVEFNAKKLSAIEPKLEQLIGLFNRMGRYDLGAQLNKGTLKIDSQPVIKYTGAVLAYGVNDRWTVGAGIPVIHYKNDIQLSKSASNIGAFKAIASQLGVDELTQGLQQLDDIDLISSFRSELKKKGFNDFENQDQTFLGDLQIASLYHLDDYGRIESQFRMNFVLPTGPKYNPDNLAALNQFGYTYIEPQMIAAYPVMDRVKVASLVGLRLYVPDQVTVRVPQNENDILPGMEQKETLTRSTGMKMTESLQLSYTVSEAWTLFGISEWAQKAEDRFEGGNQKRYDLLSRDSETQAQIVTAGASFSSVEGYQKRKKGIPAMVTAQISDTIAGKNVERQLVQEVSATLFF